MDTRIRNDMHGITAVDSANKPGYWLIRLRGRGKEVKTHHKTFAYNAHGGKDAALEKAKTYRDRWLKEHPDIELHGGPEVGLTPYHSKNTTGVSGISLQKRTNSNAIDPAFVSSWYRDGKRISCTRKIAAHGYLNAYREVVFARLEGIGCQWSELFNSQRFPPPPPDWLVDWANEQAEQDREIDLWGTYEDHQALEEEDIHQECQDLPRGLEL